MITGISHACYLVTDLDRAVDFWCNKMGLKKAFDLNLRGGEVRGVFLLAGRRTFVELFEGDAVPIPPNASHKHISYEVDDMEATVKTLRERGVPVTDPVRGGEGSFQAWVTDPDGIRIELQQFTDKSLQVEAMQRLGD
jgi:catechol 2,3-dioxygenase-like lactoylglutathione lyase family enzyme